MSSCSQDESFGDISNEDIKHLVFRTEPEEVNFTMYRSKFKDLARQQLKSGRDCHRTMGFANGFYAPSPEQFLKKRSRKLYVAQVGKLRKLKFAKLKFMPGTYLIELFQDFFKLIFTFCVELFRRSGKDKFFLSWNNNHGKCSNISWKSIKKQMVKLIINLNYTMPQIINIGSALNADIFKSFLKKRSSLKNVLNTEPISIIQGWVKIQRKRTAPT